VKSLLLSAGCLLLSVVAVFAQAGGGASDPVTGTWGAEGMSFLELKYDGNGGVTGTTIWRHGQEPEQRTPIDTGTFDPKTGALTLAGSAKSPSGEPVKYLIEGKVENGTMSGTFHIADHQGDFRFTRS